MNEELDIKEIESQGEYIENLEKFSLSANASTLNMYMKSIGNIPLLTQQEERELFIKIKNGDEAAKTKMIESNLRLVVHIAKGYTTNATQSLLDLIQEGNIGLIRAIDKYDINVGTKFSTYATYWIRQAISQSVNDQSRTIRLPNNAINMISHMNKKIAEIEDQTGQLPSEDELATALDVDVETIRNLNNMNQPLFSLEFEVSDDKETSMADLIPDIYNPTPEEVAAMNQRRDGIMSILSTLDDREKFILNRRYGIENGNPQTLEEIGKSINLTKERVRQLEIKALRKLRSPLRQKALRELI